MIMRIVFIGAVTLVLSASTASAQGRLPQRVVLSEAVMKSMVANKRKSKTPLTTRVGMVRRSGAVAAKSVQSAPTSVQQTNPNSKKK